MIFHTEKDIVLITVTKRLLNITEKLLKHWQVILMTDLQLLLNWEVSDIGVNGT